MASGAASKPVGTGRKALAFAVTAAALVAMLFVAANTGSLKVAPGQLLAGLFVEYDPDVATIWDLRFPRIFIAIAAGAALAVSGVLLQAVIRNPLADPGIIGISAGAEFGAVVVAVFFPMWFFFSPLFAFAGGLVAFGLVYGLSWNGGLSPLRIILVGVAIAAMFTGLASVFGSGGGSVVSGILNSSLSMKTWSDARTLGAYAAVGLLLSLFCCKRCDLLLLEDKTARSLGVNVNASRAAVSGVAVLLASITTAVIGPIGFLGLVVPHLARLIVGTRHRALVPYAMLLGALCLLVADTIGRTVMAPMEISAAVCMSVVGGPVFIFLLRRARGGYGA